MPEMERNQADRREGADGQQRKGAELARDAIVGGRLL
jgi:hypothetical protein